MEPLPSTCNDGHRPAWRSIAARLRFTLAMVIVLVAVALSSRTHVAELPDRLRETVGFAPEHLVQFQWYRLLTSAVFTAGGTIFYVTLMMLAATVGWAELCTGTRRTAATFWSVHLLTLLIAGVFLVMPRAGLSDLRRQLLVSARDVGPSAGYYGCLGLAVRHALHRRRTPVVLAILFVLAARFAWSWSDFPDQGRQVNADLAHLVAFPLGLIGGRIRPARHA